MEKEAKQEACFLDMPNGISKEIKYSQQFVRAPKSCYPVKAPNTGKKHGNVLAATLGK